MAKPTEHWKLLEAFDSTVDGALDRLRSARFCDWIFYPASAAGEFGMIWQAISAAKWARGSKRAAIRASIGLVVESLLVDGLLKSAIGRARPTPLPANLPLRRPRSSSFPSGHASAAAFAAVVLGEDDPWAWAYAVLAAVVATSRLYVRIHHASDVLAGLAIGAALGMATKKLFPLRPAGSRNR